MSGSYAEARQALLLARVRAGLEDVVPPGEGPVTSYDELPGLLELINKEFLYAMQLLKPFEDEIDRLCQVKTLAGHHGTYYTRIRTSWLVIRECLAVDLERLSRQDLAACMLQIHSAVVEKGSDFKGYQKQYHDLTGACVLKVKLTIADCAPDACWPGIIPCLDEVIDRLETVRKGWQRSALAPVCRGRGAGWRGTKRPPGTSTATTT